MTGPETIVMMFGLTPSPNKVGRFGCGCRLAIRVPNPAHVRGYVPDLVCARCHFGVKAVRQQFEERVAGLNATKQLTEGARAS